MCSFIEGDITLSLRRVEAIVDSRIFCFKEKLLPVNSLSGLASYL